MTKRFDYDEVGTPHYSQETIDKRRRAMLFAMRKRGELSEPVPKRHTLHDDWLARRREERRLPE